MRLSNKTAGVEAIAGGCPQLPPGVHPPSDVASSLLGGERGEGRRRLPRQTWMAGQPFAFLPHFESALLHRRKNLGDFAGVEVGSDARIAGPHDHRRQFAGLTLLERPGERGLDEGAIPIDAVVLVARTVM